MMGKLNKCQDENVSLKEDYTELLQAFNKLRDEFAMEKCLLEEESKSKNDTIRSLSLDKDSLNAEVRVLREMHKDLKDSALAGERKMMYKICDMDDKCNNIHFEYTCKMSEWQKEKHELERCLEKLHHDKRMEDEAYEMRTSRSHGIISSLEEELKKSKAQKELAEKSLSILREENMTLQQEITKQRERDGEKRMDFTQARKESVQTMAKKIRENREPQEAPSSELQIADLKMEHARVKWEFDRLNGEKGKLQEEVSSLKYQLTEARKERALTNTKFERLKESGAWTGLLMQRQDERIRHLVGCLEEERSRMKDMGVNTGRLLEHLGSERRERDSLNNELSKANRAKKDLADRLLSLEMECEDLRRDSLRSQQLHSQIGALEGEKKSWNDFMSWFQGRPAKKHPEIHGGDSLEVIESMKVQIMKMEEGINNHDILKERLSQAQSELRVLKEKVGELDSQNESLGHRYSALHEDMRKRMVALKNHLGLLNPR